MAALKGRIARLRELGMMKASELGVQNPSTAKGLPTECSAERNLAGSESMEKTSRGFLPGWSRHSDHVFMRIVDTRLSVMGQDEGEGSGLFIPGHFDWDTGAGEQHALEELSFLDFETTGLSGGTGTIAFLAAVGRFEGSCFRVAQVFLDDFPGETDFLIEVLSLLEERPFLVTYNGKAFDYPLLKTRCVMNALKIPQVIGHIDALHVARRLWRRTLGSCSLKAMEEAVLDLPRGEDIPGFLIPGIWLEYASGKKQADDRMEAVVEHNALDVVSLARLFLRIQKIMAKPDCFALQERVDPLRLAKGLCAAGRTEEALSILDEAGIMGDQRSLLFLARYYRRERMKAPYAATVARLSEAGIEGRIEKAKYEEHAARDLSAALVHVRAALRMADPRNEKISSSLKHREARLKRKLSGNA